MTRSSGDHLQGECLLLAATTTDAALLESAMQAQGHTIRIVVAPGPDTFVEMVHERDFLAHVVDLGFPELKLRTFVRTLRHLPTRPSLLAWTDEFSSTTLREVLDCGANGLLSRSDSQLSMMILEREMQIGQLRRKYEQLRERLGDSARKEAAELDNWDAPILILMEGIVVSCNRSAATEIGAGDADELLAMPILDLVTPDCASALRDAMRRVQRNKAITVDVQVQWERAGDPSKPALITVSSVEHEDELALELRGREPSATTDESSGKDQLSAWLSSSETPEGQHPMLVVFGLDERDSVVSEVGILGMQSIREEIVRVLLSAPLSQVHTAGLDNGVIALGCSTNSLEDMKEWVSARLRQISRQIIEVGDKQLTLTVSAVIHPLPPPPRAADGVLKNALNALHERQAEGQLGSLGLAGDAAGELQRREESAHWAKVVRDALQNNRFDLAFQSVACLMDDPREHVDVLLRLKDEAGEQIAPRQFMPAAQEHNLMPQVDRWVISNALGRLAEAENKKRQEVFFVRVDIATVREQEAFLKWMGQQWIEAGVSERSLVIVIRERMLQTQLRNALKLLEGLHAMNIATAIDHFGISSRSHELLERLPVDYVKLHSDFTTAIADDRNDMSAFRQIMDVAREQHIHTIAEHVSSANAMARLWQLGVNFLMGNHVHEPAAEISEQRFRIR